MARRGFGDEVWWLARDGKVDALRRAAELLSAHEGDLDYEAHRARAFALAVEGRGEDALSELNGGWTEEWPVPAAYAVDVARVRFLAGDHDGALTALELSARSAERVDGELPELVRLCVARRPELWTRALRVVLAGGPPAQRARAAAAVVKSRFGGDA